MAPSVHGAARVSRDVITEDALSVHPSLLGLPLARPWRRGAAMAVDGLLVTLLTQTPGVVFGLATALVLFRVSSRPLNEGGYLRRSLRLGFRFWAAVLLFGAAVSGWNSARDRVEHGAAFGVLAFDRSHPASPGSAPAAMALADVHVSPAPPADSLAPDSLGELNRQIATLRGDRTRLSARVAELESEGGGVLSVLRGLANDLGLGFGWIGLYFTASLALWQGRTPGKRLLGIRVIRLNAKPIGWWVSFERFGGYAAGFATGLLGFFQILWDHNRQAIHDKITETAVVREF
jgi:hypothetical protein